jgi:putative membrane protein
MLGGIVFGIISGLTPGIHVNMVAAFLLGFSPVILLVLGSEGLAAMVISIIITHSFLDIIPATFLGVPEEGTCISVLPAHSLAQDGRGEEAVRISALGSLWGVFFAIPLAFAALLFIPALQPVIDAFTGVLLIFIMGSIIVKSEAPAWCMLLFMSSGILGCFAFRYSYLTWNTAGAGEILMPLLTGLFGLPYLLISPGGKLPRQRPFKVSMENSALIRCAAPASLAGLIVGWLPGLSTASANALISGFIPYDKDRLGYLVASGATATANALIGIAVFIAIGRMRNGAMIVFSVFETPPVSFLITIAAVASLFAFLITIYLAGYANSLSCLSGNYLNTVVLIFLIIICGIFTGPFGMLILILSTVLGIIPGLVEISRIPCIGVVTLPVILYSFGFGGLS